MTPSLAFLATFAALSKQPDEAAGGGSPRFTPPETPQNATAASDKRQRLNKPGPLKKVLRPPEAAEYTGLSESTLAKRRLKGLPPQYLCLGGRAIGYDISILDQWLESCRRRSTSEEP